MTLAPPHHQPPVTSRALRRLMVAGLALTAIVTLVPLLDLATVDSITDHVRAAYPDWPADDVAADRNAIGGYLTGIGVLGVAGWSWSTLLVVRRTRRARGVTTTMFVLGAGIALVNLSYGGEAYTTIVPPLYAVLGLLPVLVGAVAVYLLWRGHR